MTSVIHKTGTKYSPNGSMNLIKKIHTADTRKPAYKWLGLKGKDAPNSDPEESRKRAFGTDITNASSKRGKIESSTSGKSEGRTQKKHESTVRHRESIARTVDRNLEDPKEGTKSFQFGPQYQNQGEGNTEKVDRSVKRDNQDERQTRRSGSWFPTL